MHVLESYALQNDLKIDRATVYEKYFPLAVDKFITIDTSNLGTSALTYDHWQLVIDLIHAKLEEQGIKIIQLGNKDCIPLRQCYMTLGQCNFNQKAYVISKSLMHVCPNNESSHLASTYNKKSVVLFSNNCYPSQFLPYWTDEDNLEILKPQSSRKPSFNPNENPKSINSIKPEEVAKKILNFAGIHTFVPEFETVKIGGSFHRPRIESIEDDNDPSFIQKVKEKSITYLLRSRKEKEQTSDFKLDYLDYGLVNQMPTRSQSDFEELKGLENLYYKSTHFIIHNNNFYPSTAAYSKNIQGSPSMQHDPQPIIDDPLFWEEEEHFHFFVKK